MARTPLMAGNWKMNLNHQEAVVLVQKLAWTLNDKKHDYGKAEVVVLPPFTDIRSVQTLVDGDQLSIGYGAQDVSAHEAGAYTGEISAGMLAKLGCTYVVVGPLRAARVPPGVRRAGQRQGQGRARRRDDARSSASASRCRCARRASRCPTRWPSSTARSPGFSAEQVGGLVVAYEPVWAIGTGEVATPDDAQEVCAAIRERIREVHGDAAADAVRVLYGGSVKAANVGGIMEKPDVDGCLVGGASLQADEFGGICRFYDMPVL